MSAGCNAEAFELGGLSPQEIIDCSLNNSTYRAGSVSPFDIVYFITQWLSYLAYFLCVIGFVVGIINIVTSAGDKTKLSSGKNILKLSAIALIIVLLGSQILLIIMRELGVMGI
jgi:hypothetical protein